MKYYTDQIASIIIIPQNHERNMEMTNLGESRNKDCVVYQAQIRMTGHIPFSSQVPELVSGWPINEYITPWFNIPVVCHKGAMWSKSDQQPPQVTVTGWQLQWQAYDKLRQQKLSGIKELPSIDKALWNPNITYM